MKKLPITAAVAFLLAGCTTPLLAPTRQEVAKNDDQATALLKQSRHGDGPTAEYHKPAGEFVDALFLPAKRESRVEADRRAQAALDVDFVFMKEVSSLQDIASSITNATHIPVEIASDALPQVNVQSSVQSQASSRTVQTTTAGALPPLPSYSSTGTTPIASGQYSAGYKFEYQGTLRGFLDLVAARFRVSWKYDHGKIKFFVNDTKTFKVFAMPGSIGMNASISNQSGTSGTSSSGSSSSGSTGSTSSSTAVGGSSTTTSFDVKALGVWDNLKDALLTIVSNKNGVVVMPITNSVTVTAPPQELDRIEQFLDIQNASLRLQALVNIKIYSVTLNKSHELGLNMNALYNSLSGNYGLTLANNFSLGTADTNVGIHILGTPGSGVPGNGAIKTLQGSSAIVGSLAEQGDVSDVTMASPLTLNNTATHLLIGQETSYLASSSSTLAANVGQTNTLTPGIYTTGVSISLLPSIMSKDELLIHYSINLSSLIQLSTVSSGGSSIQTPSLNTRDFLQSADLHSGDTIVLAGFEQSTLSATGQGVGLPTNLLLGGGMNTSNGRTVLVIVIQPIVERSTTQDGI